MNPRRPWRAALLAVVAIAATSGCGAVAVDRSGGFERVASLVEERPDVEAVEARDGEMVVSLAPGADVASIVAAVVGAGGAVEEVRRPKASLEDLFLDLVEDRAGSGAAAAQGTEARAC
jgi:hypothetical protein